MSNTLKATDTEIPRLSVREIEAKVKTSPDDIKLKEDLVGAILNRYLFGEGKLPPGSEADLKRLRELVAKLPKDAAPYSRAYLAYLDHRKKEEIIAWLGKWAERSSQVYPPLTSDELFSHIIYPFSPVSKGFWLKLAEKLNQIWPESTVVLTLQGYEKIDHENNSDEAVDYFVRVLDMDENYWLAAWECASIYSIERNWQAARGYYYRTLKSKVAREIPDLHFSLAWCLGKLKQHEEEEKYYCSCLELDPDYQYARNNLGWSLLKQGKYEEALKIFEEAIKRGNDGKYPLYNKARALAKLGRFSEAIEAWRESTHRGKPSKWVQEQISRLEKMLVKGGKATSEIDEEEGAVGSTKIVIPKKGTGQNSVQSEQLLEEMIEKRIQQGREVFGRRLQMYISPKGYGRQYAIPKIGRVDLLTEDIAAGDLVVIELKRDEGRDQVVEQISRYMNWIRANLARKNQKVAGIICVLSASNKLLLAAKNVQNLEVFEYNLTFRKV